MDFKGGAAFHAYPLVVQPWTDFPSVNKSAFAKLKALFGEQELFTSVQDLCVTQRGISPDMMADEMDLRPFGLASVESRSKVIMEEYLRLVPQATKRVVFRPYGPRDGTGRNSTTGHFTPDRWCLREDEERVRQTLFVAEYTTTYNITPEMLHLALDGQTLDANMLPDAIRSLTCKTRDAKQSASLSAKERARNQVAQALTQVYDYMIEYGLAYSYISTGEAIILLHIDYEQDVTVLNYHLSIPRETLQLPLDAGARRPEDATTVARHADRLYETPVAQVVTMILLALEKEPLSAEDKGRLLNSLGRWPGE